MAKRKAEEKSEKKFDDESSSEDDEEMLDVEFEFFDPNPEVDFQGLKTLLRQLLDVDAFKFDLSALAELILAQKLLGSTVKTDGIESDPWAFLTVLNLREHRDQPVVRDLIIYMSEQAKKNSALLPISTILASGKSEVGLVISERAFGVPTELVPPMYNMLAEEIQWALEENEPYKFSHFLVLSKAYSEIESALDREDRQAHKKHKKVIDDASEVYFFHPEDEVLYKNAIAYGTYEFDNLESDGAPDARRAFQESGVKPQGSLILLDAGKYASIVKDLERYVGL